MMKSIFKRSLAVILALSIVLTFSAGTKVKKTYAAGFADTSDYESLAELYKDYFKIGAVTQDVVNVSAKSDIVLNLFNSYTCENAMKPNANFNENSDTLFKIDATAAKLLKWADDNGMSMRGHTLVWHSQVNPKMFAVDFKPTKGGKATGSDVDVLDEECLVDRDTLIARMKSYIYGYMEYIYSNGFADTVYAWDVVNEAIDEGQEDGLRKSSWYRILGPDFLYYAFLFAREAEVYYANEYASLYGLDAQKDDLDSILPKLFYNDYNEWFPRRVDIAVKYFTEYKYNEGQAMVKSDYIKKDGDGTILGDGLIDGIGMQGHLSDTNDINTYINALKRYSDAVGEVHITELDIGCTTRGEARYFRQAQFYYDFFTALKNAVDEGTNLTCVTIWGLTDGTSWRHGDQPLLFNDDLGKKPSYNAVVMAAKGEEFDMTLAETTEELKDEFITFEPYKENGATVVVEPSTVGIVPRGSGHRSIVSLKPKINHTEDAAIGFAVCCERNEQDATLKIDISKFSGTNLTVRLFAMSDDPEIRFGIDGDSPVVLKEKNVKADDWTEVAFNFDVPKSKSVYLYAETDGHANFYLDDISFVYTKEGEEKPVITDDDFNEGSISDIGVNGENAKTDVSADSNTADDSSKDADSSAEVLQNTDENISASENTSAEAGVGAMWLIVPGAALFVFVVGYLLFFRPKKNKKKNK